MVPLCLVSRAIFSKVPRAIAFISMGHGLRVKVQSVHVCARTRILEKRAHRNRSAQANECAVKKSTNGNITSYVSH